MNRMISPCGLLDLLEHGLQAVLELAAVLGAGDQRAEVEGDHALVLERLGDVALDDALREALDDRGLADAGLADQDRVVLGAAREHLDDAADLVVAADHRVELALAGELGQVAAVLLERLVAVLGVRVVRGWLPRISRSARSSGSRAAPERPSASPAGVLRVDQRQQQVLGGDVLVLERLRLAQRLLEDTVELRRDVRGRALGPGQGAEALLDRSAARPPVFTPSLPSAEGTTPPSCSSSAFRRCSGVDLRVVALLRQGLGRRQRFLGLHRELVEPHDFRSLHAEKIGN